MKKIEVSEGAADRELFVSLLYDERLSEGDFLIPQDVFYEAGGYNLRIRAKRNYELLLRLAKEKRIRICDCGGETPDLAEYMHLCADEEAAAWEGIRTDCYILAKYMDEFRQDGCFDDAAASVIRAADSVGIRDEAVSLMEQMLMRQTAYYEIDDAAAPILIYLGPSVCYDMLNRFAKQFGDALKRAGARVEYIDLRLGDKANITQCIGRHYRAVIGWQTYAFGITMKDAPNLYLHDLHEGPLFNFVFDHPIWLKEQLTDSSRRMRVLTLDRNYADFISHYYGKKAYLFPPAGVRPDAGPFEKKYDLTFIGTYGNAWEEMRLLHQMKRSDRFLANRFLRIMRKNLHLPAEDAFARALDFYGIQYEEQDFPELFYPMRRIIYCVMQHYRRRVLACLLAGGLTVHVFGDSWLQSPLFGHPGLICHPDVTFEESMQIWQESRLSLNVMSWHKGGFTERMANIMLSRAVLVTDDTSYLDGKFADGTDLLIFKLEAMHLLPGRLKEYLGQPQKLREIAENGCRKAKECHTWDRRAKEFLAGILEEEAGGEKWHT